VEIWGKEVKEEKRSEMINREEMGHGRRKKKRLSFSSFHIFFNKMHYGRVSIINPTLSDMI
jgi:hypothetical protein